MKAVILAGGLGTRLSEETDVVPKPMVSVGGHPIIWHIMSMYERHGISDFIVCAGFKQQLIKQYFYNFYVANSDVTFDLTSGKFEVVASSAKKWKVTVVDTGVNSMTGGRLGRIRDFVSNETFCMTYGDGVSDVDIGQSIKFHKSHGKLATVTAVPAPGRFGDLVLNENHVESFAEKREGQTHRINGGFFVLEPGALSLIDSDDCVWEKTPMQKLAMNGELKAFRHDGFWQPMDTLKDKRYLDGLCNNGSPPWFN